MNKKVLNRIHLMCAWSGIAFIVLTFAGLLIAGFFPPLSPANTPQQAADLITNNLFGVRFGGILMMAGSSLYIPFTVMIAVVLSRIEGGGMGVLPMLQITGGLFNAVFFFYPPMWWEIASFRPERAPEIISLLNDIGWIQYVGGLWPFFAALLSVGAAAFVDDSETPVFPRWYGFVCIWEVLTFLPGQVLFFVTKGPFAWDGLFSWYVPLAAFFFFIVGTTYFILKAIKRQPI